MPTLLGKVLSRNIRFVYVHIDDLLIIRANYARGRGSATVTIDSYGFGVANNRSSETTR